MSNAGGSGAAVNANILIVEDDPTTARYLELSLKRLGCQEVRIASSSQRALQMMRQQAAELVLMDVDIDGSRDGIETTKLMRTEFDVAVIFLTGYNDEMTMARARQVSPLAYLVKPVKAEDLRNSVTSALHTHRLASRATGHVAVSAIAAPAPRQAPSSGAVDDAELHRLKSELAAVAVHDSATGLFNRRGFHLLGEQQLKLAQCLGAGMALTTLTVSNMLAIEIEFGAAARDQARQDLAGVLRTTFPSDLAGRIDDEVFVLLTAEQRRKSVSDMLKGAIAIHDATAARAYRLQCQIRVATRGADGVAGIADLMASVTEVGEHEVEVVSKSVAKPRQRARR